MWTHFYLLHNGEKALAKVKCPGPDMPSLDMTEEPEQPPIKGHIPQRKVGDRAGRGGEGQRHHPSSGPAPRAGTVISAVKVR